MNDSRQENPITVLANRERRARRWRRIELVDSYFERWWPEIVIGAVVVGLVFVGMTAYSLWRLSQLPG